MLLTVEDSDQIPYQSLFSQLRNFPVSFPWRSYESGTLGRVLLAQLCKVNLCHRVLIFYTKLAQIFWSSQLLLPLVTSVESDSVRPCRRQPTRFSCPWDSPGKNIGVGCHFFLQCLKVEIDSEVTQSCPTVNDPMDYNLCPWDFPGKSTGVGCHCLLWIITEVSSKHDTYFLELCILFRPHESCFPSRILIGKMEKNTSTSVTT